MQTSQATAVTQPEWHSQFLQMLPTIEAIAARAYRRCEPEIRQELTAQMIAECVVAFHRLHELGRTDEAFATPLARFAIKRVGCGLQPGLTRNQYDVGSRHCEHRHGVTVERLHRQDRDNDWSELVVEDRRQGCPAQIAALRIDLRAWLDTLSIRDRGIALLLAMGERTCDVARKFGLTAGRVAQLRRELSDAWWQFHGLDSNGQELEPAAA